jgi:hypothetical protein
METPLQEEHHENIRRVMDEHADKVISKWHFANLPARLLPPPLDIAVVGEAFAELGTQICAVYGVPADSQVLLDLGKAMAHFIKPKLVGFYKDNSILTDSVEKEIKQEVSVWTTFLLEPVMKTFIAQAVGKTFKQYCHSYELGPGLTPDEAGRMALEVLRRKLW